MDLVIHSRTIQDILESAQTRTHLRSRDTFTLVGISSDSHALSIIIINCLIHHPICLSQYTRVER